MYIPGVHDDKFNTFFNFKEGIRVSLSYKTVHIHKFLTQKLKCYIFRSICQSGNQKGSIEKNE